MSKSLQTQRIPPQAKDLEKAVLGAILIERDAYDAVCEIINEDAFYVDAHQEIFHAMKKLKNHGQPIDIPMIQTELESMGKLEGIGGKHYLDTLTTHVVSSFNTVAHCRVILQKFINRELIRVCGEIVQEAYEDMSDGIDLLDRSEEMLSGINNHLSFGDMVGIDMVLVDAIRKIEEWRHTDSSITGVPSGFTDLDKATRGWQPGDLIIIAARPSVGKTAFALNIVRNAALHLQQAGKNESVAVWSLEMKAWMLAIRMLSAQSGELMNRLQTGRLSEHEMKQLFEKAVRVLATLKIFFDDNPGLSIQKLRSKARRLRRKNKLSLIVVDYLQLMVGEEKAGNREQEVSKISRGLKNLAMELNVPIIALSQLSRDIEKRGGVKREPQLSDIRESGAIEQDADLVIFLWGPSDEETKEDSALITRRYIKIAKQRNGMLVKIDLDFKNEIQLFSDIVNIPSQLPTGKWKPIDSNPDLFSEGQKKEVQP